MHCSINNSVQSSTLQESLGRMMPASSFSSSRIDCAIGYVLWHCVMPTIRLPIFVRRDFDAKMLANIHHSLAPAGSLGKDVHLPATSLYELIDFIAGELPRWRDRADRKRETAETLLSSQLCAHLNSAARHSRGWDILQFRTEEPDEREKSRSIDLVPAPSAAIVWVDGRRYVDFDP